MSADFWAGYLSGAASIIIGNPLDLIKVRLQSTASASNLHDIQPAASSPQRSPYSALTDTRTLLRGLPAPILTYGALNALLYTSYNRSLALFDRTNNGNYGGNGSTLSLQYSYLAYFSAGALAGLATFFISTPTELVKCRAQVLIPQMPNPTSASTASAPPASSSWDIACSTFRHEGLRGLYLGGTITAARDAIGYGFYFWTYEACKSAMENDGKRYPGAPTNPQNAEAVKVLLAGGIAGIVTWASIYPLDVVKTRVQTQTLPGVAAVSSESLPVAERTSLLQRQRASQETEKYLGSWTIAKQAYRNEGSSVFFRGLTICCVRAFIVSAAQWAVYEWMMRYLNEVK